MLAVGGLSLLMVAGGVTGVYALRATTGTARQLSEDRLQRMQQAQELVQRTLLVEREWYRLASAESEAAMRDSQAGIVTHLEEFDRLADRLARGEDDIEILGLRHASQVFRNLVTVAAQQREGRVHPAAGRGSRGASRPSQPELDGREELARQLDAELRRHAAAMVAAAQLQSDRYARDYRQAAAELVEASSRRQRWVMVLLAGSLLVAWLIAQQFLGRHVLARLQQVSRGLRQRDSAGGPADSALEGGDEIEEMARAVDRFQEDRRKLVQRTAELEAAYQELEELSYAISHEMRTPLRALDGFSKILLDRAHARLDDEGRRMLKVLRDNAQRQGRLVDDILRFLALGRQKMAYGSVDVGRLASELFEQIQAAEPGRHLRLEVGGLPPAWGDRAMIRQALHNLLSNAVKFSPADAEALIEVRGAADEREDVYCVRDRGVGFDMRYASKLFRVFERVHPTGLYDGTGMGLAIVKRVIDRHGGRVWAEGREGEGASFHFALPGPPQRRADSPLRVSR
jgi:signal transduction histidine kinase